MVPPVVPVIPPAPAVSVVPPPAPVVPAAPVAPAAPPPTLAPAVPPAAPAAPPPVPVVEPPVAPVSVSNLISWLWIGLILLILLGVGLVALLVGQLSRVVRARQDQQWVQAHVEAVAGAASGVGVEVMESRTDFSPPTLAVRIEPHADSGTQILEEARR
jgi:hypothetical protein